MSHFPDHPKDQTRFSTWEMFQEYCRLDRKWFKTKKDKHAMKVLDEAMKHNLTEAFKRAQQ